MHQISRHFTDCDCFFTSFYSNKAIDFFIKKGVLEFTMLGGRLREQTENYFITHNLITDYKAKENQYDLVFTSQDLIIPGNIRKNRIVLVQEKMTEPDNLILNMVKIFPLPRWLAGTSTTGLSNAYDLFFVASEGYRDLFISKGVNPLKIRVTGIPDFDNAAQYLQNSFPYRNYVLAATSNRRENMKYENRKRFIRKVLTIADGRQVIFKLHPNENWYRATMEIYGYAPDALVYSDVSINPLIANCDVLVTLYSPLVYIGMALGKEVHSDFSMDLLQKLTPVQNNGTSASEIARVSRQCLLDEHYAFTW